MKKIEKFNKSKEAMERLQQQMAQLQAKHDKLRLEVASESLDNAVQVANRFLMSLFKGQLAAEFNELVSACRAVRDADPTQKCFIKLDDDEYHRFLRDGLLKPILTDFDMLRVIDSVRRNEGEKMASELDG